MNRTPNEIRVALGRDGMNEVHALNEIEYQEMMSEIPNDKDGKARRRKIKAAHATRLEQHRKWLDAMEMTEDEKEEKARERKQRTLIPAKDNPYANNQ